MTGSRTVRVDSVVRCKLRFSRTSVDHDHTASLSFERGNQADDHVVSQHQTPFEQSQSTHQRESQKDTVNAQYCPEHAVQFCGYNFHKVPS